MSYENFTNNIEKNIKEYGCSVVSFPGPGNRTITYSIGRSDLGLHELVIVGLAPHFATMIINDITKDRAAFQAGDETSDFTNLPIRFGAVCPEAVSQYLCQAVYREERIGQPAPEALQIIMSDSAGRFPGDEGFNSEQMRPQFLLDKEDDLLY